MANKSDAINIACDYISLQNLSITHQLISEFHEYRLMSQTGEDVLSLYDNLCRKFANGLIRALLLNGLRLPL